ncbi:DUF6578 domain-containing protein [Streptomyces sp. NBC_01013]|uniref:DUF6578 domain-containing protein n=1 Tax=Streptomyces sp. NBC_01013 TaxID=2903718 RepID=UPI00386E6EDE
MLAVRWRRRAIAALEGEELAGEGREPRPGLTSPRDVGGATADWMLQCCGGRFEPGDVVSWNYSVPGTTVPVSVAARGQ